MSAQSLGSRAIIGEFFKRLRQDVGTSWINQVSMLFTSDQSSEEYRWLGQVPPMREWVGGRQAKGLIDQGITIENKHYESTLEFLKRELRRDKTGQVLIRIREQVRRAQAHWASLLSTLIVNGESTVGYDGQFFFDTDHVEGNNQTNQSNDISVSIAALPTQVSGTPAAPSVEDMQFAIAEGIKQMLAFKDDQNEPMNEDATNFLVMVPTSYWITASRAVSTVARGSGFPSQSDLNFANFSIGVAANARLDSSWTDKFAVFRTDAEVKPFIRQEEQPVQVAAKAEGSEFEFDNDAHQYGLDAWRNVGYGMWQMSTLVTLTA